MPRQRPRRRCTGNHRRRAVRDTQCDYRADRSLNAGGISDLRNIQACWSHCMMATNSIMQLIIVSIFIRQLALDQLIPIDLVGFEAFIDRSFVAGLSIMTLSSHWMQRDFLLADIDPADEFPANYGLHRKRRIQDLTNHEARSMTRFKKSELRRLFILSNLPAHIEMDNGHGHSYTMTGQEVFIFGLTKMAHGTTNRQLCEQYFGGCPTRWTFAYAYFCRYFNNRYIDILGFEGLERFVHDFPRFSQRVAEKLNKDKLNVDPITRVRMWVAGLGLSLLRFRIVGFIDGSFFRIYLLHAIRFKLWAGRRGTFGNKRRWTLTSPPMVSSSLPFLKITFSRPDFQNAPYPISFTLAGRITTSNSLQLSNTYAGEDQG